MQNAAIYLGDYITPMHSVFAVFTALHHRKKTGQGQLIDAPAMENALPLVIEALMEHQMNERQMAVRENREPLAAPQGCYRCRGEDRWVNISVFNDDEWRAFCKVMGDPEWSRDGKFATSLQRWRNHDELDARIEEWTSQQDHYDVMHQLQKAGVPAGAVLDPRDQTNDPHFNERGFFQDIYQEDCGVHRYPGFMWRFTKTPLEVRRPPVRLGQDNEYVYKELLRVSDEEYEDLIQKGHIGTEYIPGAPVV
jgi:crotonobetainyl-CoA:carnitine CoA-transferase CaiB-like acyl-CoA transferase